MNDIESSKPWNCSNCNEEVDPGFDVCWNCGTSVDGVGDPSFLREIEATECYEDGVPTIKCEDCGYGGKVLEVHRSYPSWVFPVSLVLGYTLLAIGPWLSHLNNRRNDRIRVCPHCGGEDKIFAWHGEFAPDAEAVWLRADREEADRHRKITRDLIWLVLLTFSGAALFFLTVWAATMWNV